MNYSSFEQGSIVIAKLMFSNQQEAKTRPILIVSKTDYNQKSRDIVVLKITSADKKTAYAVKLSNKDMEKGELKNDSFISIDFVTTLEKNITGQEIAKISKEKLAEVKQKIRELYDL